MELKEIFETLVRNRKRDDLSEYHSRKFSFDTVFSIYSYSYCCCPCAFEHEFLDYITEDGINENIFQRIKGNISRGKCEHVNETLPAYVHQTSVIGNHIAAGYGVLPTAANDYQTTIFRLYAYMIAIMKKHGSALEEYLKPYFDDPEDEDDELDDVVIRLIYAKRSIEKPGFIEISTKHITDICAIMKDPLLVTMFTYLHLNPCRLENFNQVLSDSFEILSQDKSSDMFKRMSDFVQSNGYSCDSGSREIVNFGTDIDGNLSLELDMAVSYPKIRVALETAIYENADIDQNKKCVVKAIRIDEAILADPEIFIDQQEWYFYGGIHNVGYSGTCLVDGTVHSPYGHEGKSFPLNFAAPLLLECGYHVDKAILHKALDRKKLHDKELEYFRQYLNNPKSLKLSCCNALRKIYKGHAIYKFVEEANLPQTISDLVLLKHVLKSI